MDDSRLEANSQSKSVGLLAWYCATYAFIINRMSPRNDFVIVNIVQSIMVMVSRQDVWGGGQG